MGQEGSGELSRSPPTGVHQVAPWMPLQYDHGRIPVEDGPVANRMCACTDVV